MSKVKLGEVAIEHKETCKSSKDGYPIVGLEHLVPEEVTLTAWDEGSDNTFTKMFRKGNVLFGRRRAYLKKAAVAPFDGICSGDITVIEAIPDRILPELLPFIIQNDTLFDFAVEKSAGSLSPRVKWQHLQDYEFFLPEMEKQKELAALLWAMDRTKQAYKRLISATDELVKSQFIDLIDSSGYTNTLGEYIKRYTPQRCGNKQLPVLSVTKENALVLQHERFKTAVASDDKSNYWIVPKGFIVQGIHIDEANFGLQNLMPEGIVSPAYKIWQIISSDVVPELLEMYLRCDRAIDYYKRSFQGTTVARRQSIKPEVFLAMPVNFPPLEEQVAFWHLVQQTDKSKYNGNRMITEIMGLICFIKNERSISQ